MRGVQQGFRRNAANVQAGTTETRLAFRIGVGIGFTTGDVETQLRRPNGGNIATGAPTDNENVKLLGHDVFPFQPQRHKGTEFAQHETLRLRASVVSG
jgi:hypothetical protein